MKFKKILLIVLVVFISGLANAGSMDDFDKLKAFLVRNRDNELKVRDVETMSPDQRIVADIQGFICYGFGNYNLDNVCGEMSKNEFSEKFTSISSPVCVDRRPSLFKDFSSSTSEFTTESGTVFKVSLKSKSFGEVSELKAAYYRVLNGLQSRLSRDIEHSETSEPFFAGSAKIDLSNGMTLSLWPSTLTRGNCLVLDLIDNTLAELTTPGRGHQYHEEATLPKLDMFLGFRLRDDFASVAGDWTPALVNENGKTYNFNPPQNHRLLSNAQYVVMTDNDGKVKLIGCNTSFDNRANANAEVESLIAKLEKKYQRRFFKNMPSPKNKHLAEWKMRFFATKMKPLAENVEAELTVFITKENSRYSIYMVLLRCDNLDFIESLYESAP